MCIVHVSCWLGFDLLTSNVSNRNRIESRLLTVRRKLPVSKVRQVDLVLSFPPSRADVHIACWLGFELLIKS